MNTFSLPFVPGSDQPSIYPFMRFLPPIPAEMTANWLKKNLPIGSWIIDPLGSNPMFDLEAAKAGYRVLVTSNNPVLSFMLEILAKAPSTNDFQIALSELASARLGNERLETHLQSLYQTKCSGCGHTIQAQSFLWKKDEAQPFARQYRCPFCGDEGDHLLEEDDIQRLAQITRGASLHRARAAERVRISDEQAMTAARGALQFYLPRSLYFLFTILNKIEGLPLTEERRKLLTALVLSACDAGNALWAWPSPRNRPRQLSIPPQFRENNLWLAIENAVKEWSVLSAPISITHWPDFPPSEGGICLYKGRMKALERLPEALQVLGAAFVVPRPNQAFWTLCALWSGWLWGQESLSALKNVLVRKRYDWHWFTHALYNTLIHLRRATNNTEIQLLTIIPELTPGFFSAILLAVEASGFHLLNLAFEPDQALAQAVLSFQKQRGEPVDKSHLQELVYSYLTTINQPATYLQLHIASLSQMASRFELPFLKPRPEPDLIGKIQMELENALTTSEDFVHLHGQPNNLESGTWGFSKTSNFKVLPLHDRTEIEFVRFLNDHPRGTFQEIYTFLCERLPGLLTPHLSFVRACLESYATPETENKGYWTIRPADTTANRRKDVLAIQETLVSLGKQLGYQTQQKEEAILWLDCSEPLYTFFVLASSIISRFVLQVHPTSSSYVIVFPGSRSNLLAYKLQNDTRLARAIQSNWHFLKFRHLRAIAERTKLTPELWQNLLDQDPPVWQEPAQMTFF